MSENVSKLIDALQSGDMAAANSVFQDDIAGRMSAALDAEKVAVAGNVFGDADQIESDEIEVDDDDPVEYDSEEEE